jgi:hypothetical protein
MANTIFKTPKGTELELIKLKSKDYMLVSQRLIWFNEEVKNFDIDSEFNLLTEEETICTVTVTIFDDSGKITRKAKATKRETKKDFSDHTEKAQSSALGRALSMLSFGTAQALADFDELHNDKGEVVNRLADAPVEIVKAKPESKVQELAKVTQTEAPKRGFGLKKETPVVTTTADGWE